MKHKFGLIGFSYLAGLICATIFNSYFIFIFAGVLLLIAMTLLFTKKKNFSVIFFTAFAAVSVYGIYTIAVYDPIIAYDGSEVQINGTISEVRRYSNDTASYIVDTNLNGVNTSVTLFSTDTQCSVGDNISFTGKLSEMKDNTEFAEESYYKTKGVFLKASASSGVEITPNNSFNLKVYITEYSEYIGNRIKIMLPGDEGDLLKAIFLGDKSGLSYKLSNNIKRAGISHFTAVSGLHLTIISHILMLIISLTPLKRHRIFKFITLSALIFMFMIFFRMSVSVIRAGIMLIVYYGSEPFMRKGSTLNSMGIAVLAITLFQPYACLDIGLLLSLAGTFGIGVLSPFFCRKLRSTASKPFKSALIGSICATLCTFPLSCLFFGGFSVIGILMNMLLYPLFFPALVCLTFFAALGGTGYGFMFISGLCAKTMIAAINFFGGFKYSYISLHYDFIGMIFAASVIFVIAVYFIFKSPDRTAMSIGLSFCILVGCITASYIIDSDKAKLLMFSDGDDACVIVEKQSSICVIASDDSEDILEYLAEYFQNNFLDEISVIKIINSTHNNLSPFEEIPCQIFAPPDKEEKSYLSGEDIEINFGEKYGTIKFNNISVTVSPASEPIDDDVCVIYGYKKNIPELLGRVYCSNRRIDDKYGFTNLYYQTAEYFVSENNIIQPIYQ